MRDIRMSQLFPFPLDRQRAAVRISGSIALRMKVR